MKRSNKAFFPNLRDNTGEQLIAVLLEGTTLTFEEIFRSVETRLKARNLQRVGEELIRLRTYEKLQALVAEGAVKKDAKTYKATFPALKELETQLNRSKRSEADMDEGGSKHRSTGKYAFNA